jgi:NAD(P)-dependent dehydrogenase (short-subunit alcohol dehydrogenase family)
MFDLTDKVLVVTGGNGGIGLGMAQGLVNAGGEVAVWGRDEDKNRAAVEQLRDSGATARSYVCDVAIEAEVVESMSRTIRDFGRLDGLFANAGRSGTGTAFVDLSLSEWRKVMAVNLDGVFLCLREAARALIQQGEGGSLVAVSSTSAIHGAAGNEAYGTSKTALTGLVRALAVALARYNIRVNSLLPGWTLTDLAAPGFENETFREVTTRRTPIRRWGEPDEFAAMAVFLADPAQILHTGQELTVDGGYTVF